MALADYASTIIPAVAAIGGALVGAIASYLPALLMERRKEIKRKEAITAALLSEVNAILKIAEARKYVSGVEGFISHMKQKGPHARQSFGVRIAEDYARIYRSNLAELGLIDKKILTHIIEFHQLVESVVQDIGPGGLLYEEQQPVESFEQLLQVMKLAVETGEKAISADV